MARIWAKALELAVSVGLLLFALYHSIPLLHRVRPLFPAVMAAAVLLMALALWRPCRHRAFSAAFCFAALGAGWAAHAQVERSRAEVLAADPAALGRLGRHVVVGFERFEDLVPLVERGAVGGIFLAPRNVRGKSIEEIARRIAYLQAIQADAGRPPLLVMADQEGGSVSRLSPPLPYLPTIAQAVSSTQDEAGRIELAGVFGTTQGEGLAAMGVNVNLGPVVDLPDGGTSALVDPYSRIATRAVSVDPQEAARLAAAYARGLEGQGVRATFKHFPGLGRARADTHFFRTELDAPLSQLEVSDWVPYREALAGTQSLVMVGHVVVSAVDPERVATLSPLVVDGVLRSRLGHAGLVITDDLCMRPITGGPGGLRAAGALALSAGVDLLLVSYDADQYWEVMGGLLEADAQGRLDRAKLSQSEARLSAPRAAPETEQRGEEGEGEGAPEEAGPYEGQG